MFFREITTVYAAYHTKTNHTLCVSGEEFPRVEAPGTYSNSRKLKQKKISIHETMSLRRISSPGYCSELCPKIQIFRKMGLKLWYEL